MEENNGLGSLRAIRQRDHPRYVRGLIRFLRTSVNLCHPSSDVGWWCCYEEQMKDLVTFLSESQSSLPEFWSGFRTEVSNQLSLCRQCAIAYHKAVNEWELSNEVSQWSKGVIRKRVCELVEWDAERVIPAIEKGAICARLSDDPGTLAARTECREAFLESLLSLRLCMRQEFCAVLGKVFLTRSPAKTQEDVVPFIKAHGVIPPGVAALCFHSSYQVREWAKAIYIANILRLPADEQALQLLISKGLRLALSKATGPSESYDSKCIGWAPDLQCLWEGLDTLLTSIAPHELEAMMKRNKKFPIMDAISHSLSNAANEAPTETAQGLPEVLSILRFVLLSVPFASLFGYGSLTPEKLLDAIFTCLRTRVRHSCERRLLLDMMFNVTSSAMRRGNKCDASLFVKCFDFLEDMVSSQRTVSDTAREVGPLNVADFRNSSGDILTTGARLLQKFYWHSWPRLPVDDSKRIAAFVTKIVRGIPERECSWALVRNVLLTDVFNLIRSIYEPQEVEKIANTFFSFHASISSKAERRSLAFESAIREISRSQVSLTWVDDLWNNMKKGCHTSGEIDRTEKVRNFEMSLALDLHRLVGVLDPRRCGDLVKSEMFEPNRYHLNHKREEHRVKRLVSQRMGTVHETIVSMMRVMPDISEEYISLTEFPFHAAHLLLSSTREVSRHAHLSLQRRCEKETENATYAGPKSRDKLLVHILEQDKDDSGMIFEGFMSATRIMSIQGAAVSGRAYPSFFRWYSLLASGDCRILRSGEIAKGALGILFTFVENWKSLESQTSPEMFSEIVCRLFTSIPEIWDPLNDIQESTERKTEDMKDHFDKGVRPWMRKLVLKLFTMHDLRDETLCRAWVRMVTHENLKLAFQSIDSYRVILMGILAEHEAGRGSLWYALCRQLAEAFSLEESSQILDRWSVNEARRAASQIPKASTTKNYRETKIDNFFSSRLNKSGPLAWTEERTISAPKKMYDNNRLQRRGTAAQRRLMGQSSSAHMGANRSLHALRKDHRHARAELRRAAPTYETVSRNREPTKTRFELLREERIAEKERKKSQVVCDGTGLHPSEFHSEDLPLQGCIDPKRKQAAQESSVFRIDSHEDMEIERFCYPTARRELQIRSLEQIKRDVLLSQEVHSFETETYTNGPPDTFDDIESYVNYWEPLLVAEFRAGIWKKVDEERLFFEQNKRDQSYIGCRMVFEVDGPAEDVGYLHTLSITSHQRVSASLEGRSGIGSGPFDVSSVQVSDIVMLEIPAAGQLAHDGTKNRSGVAIAIVASVLRTKNELRLMLRVVFDTASAPGKGRLLKVSKLLSFATLQRQLDALWSLPKVQDGILWSLLDPVQGWRMKRDLESRDEIAINGNSSTPLRVIQKMESLGVLNASQVRAITDVVRSCSCLFAPRGGSPRARYTKDNHGSVSLIQGPPGTGKTSTIIALVSALLSRLGSNPFRRRAKVVIDGSAHILNVPAIRVLICAPSNAAVDELMLRVMNDGLFTASENRVCPRMVRVGRGATLEALQALEIHSLSKSQGEQPSPKDSTAPTQRGEHHKLLEEVKKHIGELDGDRRKIAFQLDKASEENGTSVGASRPGTEKFREIGEKLDILHDKKKLLHSILSHERDAERKEDACRRREKMRTLCNTLATASVVFATLSSSGHEDMKTLGAKFDVVIIDEAGQSCEPEALIPMTLGQHVGSSKQRFMHTVLVGDPRQLPATVLSNNHRVVTAMGRSLFERIGLSDPSTVHLLDTQYRMHPKISSFPSLRFYGGLLRNSDSVKTRDMHKVWHRDERKRFGPLTIFDTTGARTKEARSRGGSLSNDTEAKLVIKGLISMVKLYRVENLVDRIVVLSPYKQQVLLLKKLVSSNAALKQAKVEVSTIDGIQGREKSIVVLSTVRSGHSKNIGFVKDDRRLNVALTRAKDTLMIFGHADFLSTHSDAWADLISHCRKRSQILSLTNAYHVTFPECRSASCKRLPKEVLRIDHLSDIDDDIDVIGRRVSDQVDLGGTKSAIDVKLNLHKKGSTGTVDLREERLSEQPSLREVNGSALRSRQNGYDHRKESQSRHQGFGPHGEAKNAITVGHKAAYCVGRSQQSNHVYDSTDLNLERVLPLPKLAWHLHSPEKQEDEDTNRRPSSSGEKRLSHPRDLPKTNAKSTAQSPQVDGSAKPRADSRPVQKSFMSQDHRAADQGAYGYSGERSPSGSSPYGLQYPSQFMFQGEQQDRIMRRSTGRSITAPNQASVSASATKRSLYSSYDSQSLPDPGPLRKKSRHDRHWKHGATERKHGVSKVRRHPEQNRTDSYLTQRRTLQPTAKGQTGQRLVTHHRNRIQQSRRRQARFLNADVKHQSQTKSNKATHAFSLADTQTKLKSTLDVARKARRSGTLG